MLDYVGLGFEILSSLLLLVFLLLVRKICDIVFEKARGRAGKVNRTSVYGEAAVQKGSLKKVL